MDSPPKRLTRARAAAKASEPIKSTKIVTAAAKARAPSTATAGTQSTAAKRKVRADEVARDSAEGEASVTRAPRGRPRKTTPAEEKPAPDPAPSRTSRGRSVRQAGAEAPTAQEPVATTRARGRLRQPPSKEADTVTRRPVRPTSMTASSLRGTSAIVTRPSVKKTVTFQEPDKENLEIRQDKKPPTTQALRTRPTRYTTRATATSGKKTAERPKSVAEKKAPLSLRKITQMPVSRAADSSEDELAASKPTSPLSLIRKSPVKISPTVSIASPVKKHDALTVDNGTGQLDAEEMDDAILHAPSLDSPPKKLPSSPTKELLKSPAKKIGAVPLLVSPLDDAMPHTEQPGGSPSVQKSLLLSAAKRPVSPRREIDFQSNSTTNTLNAPKTVFKSAMFQTPARKAGASFKTWTDPRSHENTGLTELKAFQPLLLKTPTRAASRGPQSPGKPQQSHLEETPVLGCDSPSKAIEDLGNSFPGRLSAVLPRHADPALNEITPETAQSEADAVNIEVLSPLPAIASDEVEDEMAESILSHHHAQPSSPTARTEDQDDSITIYDAQVSGFSKEPLSPLDNPVYQLRAKDASVCHDFHDESASEDEEMESRFAHVNQSPERPSRSMMDARRDTLGLNSLADQLSSWSASSPQKHSKAGSTAIIQLQSEQDSLFETEGDSTLGSHFFEDEMRARADDQAMELQGQLELDEIDGELDESILENIPIIEEDVALAQEADDLSALEQGKLEEVTGNISFSNCLSEPSQEYGDENEVPKTENSMHSPVTHLPVTPARSTQLGWFATTKVPLKPSDESTPSPLKKRGYSVPRVTSSTSTETTRNSFVSPLSKVQSSSMSRTAANGNDFAAVSTPLSESLRCTPLNATTPTQTPRREVDVSLLRGAVVYVDVRTADGTDASNIFIELLGQMGASCVDAWNDTPETGVESHEFPSMMEITHVVFKDGDRSTLEKAQRARNVVHCVGVNWVLDCERENKWLDEAAYSMKTRRLPSCDARRRQSMKLETGDYKSPQAAYTPVRRRESTAWQWTPSDSDEQEIGQPPQFLLTPVPKTPAPEAVAAYAAEILETSDDEAATSRGIASPTQQRLMMRSCPPGVRHFDVGEEEETRFDRDSDEEVLQRLMAARRKSAVCAEDWKS